MTTYLVSHPDGVYICEYHTINAARKACRARDKAEFPIVEIHRVVTGMGDPLLTRIESHSR